MSRLKLLELHVIGRLNLPIEIGDLIFLEYLSLEGEIWASEFPKEWRNLKFLKFFSLHVRGGDLASIPLGVISYLQQLKVLRFNTMRSNQKSREEREFLGEVESLPKIEELSIEIKTENGIKSLESAKLQSCIYALRLAKIDSRIKMPFLLASMSKMNHLRRLGLIGLNRVEDFSIFRTYHLTMLRTVTIYNCQSIIHVTWFKYAPLLQYLAILGCVSMEEVIKEEGTEDEEGIENVDSVFSSLVQLSLWNLPKLKSIHKTILSFPFLRSIIVYDCPNLKKLPFDSNTAKYKLREIKGDKEWWNNLEWDDSTAMNKFQSKFQE